MGLFGKKKKESSPDTAYTMPEKPEAPMDIPLEQVTRMKHQGLTDNQIVQTLQRNGYKSYQIFDAMNQADLTPGVPQQAGPLPIKEPDQDYSELYPPDNQSYETQPQDFEDFQQAPVEQDFGTGEMDRIEEVAEAIIDEKWSEFMRNINKIVEWKERVESRIDELEQQIGDLKNNLNELNKSLIDKMSEYDKNMSSINTEIKAMEKVFQKMLPTFTENISELSRITKEIKGR